MNTELIAQLTAAGPPFAVSRAGRVTGPDATAHAEAYERDPAGYALLAVLPGVRVEQRARILLQLLAPSRLGMDAAARGTVDRVVRLLVLGLPAPTVGAVMLALRHQRANHKHVTRAALRLLFEHADAAGFVHTHRRIALSIVEHAIGKATARGVARSLRTADPSIVDVRRALLRYVSDERVTSERLVALYTRPAAALTPAADAAARPDLDLDGARPDLDLDGARPAVVTATNRGDLAATLVHRLRGGASADLDAAQRRYLAAAAAPVPRYPGRLALVVDRSESMRGYGEREWAVQSQAAALELVLGERCERLVTVPTRGAGTDLAGGVIAALAQRPDLVAVVTDGYENTHEGDLARVVATLPRLGIDVPVVVCVATFGHSDDLALRRPAPAVPQRPFWHEADLGPLVLWLLTNTRAAGADAWLRAALTERLELVEGGLAA
jgi:hypothetical protein